MNLRRVQQITDIIHNTISYTALEGLVISTSIFNRLHKILQSSVVYLTYSSNNVKRFEHSIGTMYLAGKIFYNSIVNNDDLEVNNLFISECKSKIYEWYTSIDFTADQIFDLQDCRVIKNADVVMEYSYPKSSLYQKNLPSNLENNEFVYMVVFQAIRIAGLLHDIGHLPYSHVFEDAVKVLYKDISSKSEPNDSEEKFVKIMKKHYGSDEAALHESLGIALIKQIKTEIVKDIKKCSLEERSFASVVFYFVEQILKSESTDDSFYSDLHNIIAGIFDADRLDYCSRDSYCSGTRKDLISYDRIFLTYKLFIEKADISERNKFLFCPSIKCVKEVEELLNRRFEIFTKINYHHRVHKHEIILAEVLYTLAKKELSENKFVDYEVNSKLPLYICSIWKLVEALNDNKKLLDYTIIQFDDSWLDTLLKSSYFSMYFNGEDYSNDPIWNMFDELISTKKHFFSFYKRYSDFINFCKNFIIKWYNNTKNKDTTDSIKKIINEFSKYFNDDGTPKQSFNSPRPIYNLKNVSGIFKLHFDNIGEFDFYKRIENEMNTYLKTAELGVDYVLIRSCSIKKGCNSVGYEVSFWDDKNELKVLPSISNISEMLNEQISTFPPFHLYYLQSKNNDLDKSMLEEKLIEIIIQELDNLLKKPTVI